MGIRHSPRTAYSPWTMDLLKYKTEILVLIFECSYMTHLKIGHFKSICTLMHIIHNHFQNSIFHLMKIVFHTRPRIPLTFDLNLNRDTSKTCISRYCSQLPEHSHYDKSDLNPFFYKTLSKPIPQWFLAVETAMLQIYSTVYETLYEKLTHTHILQKLTTKVNPFHWYLCFKTQFYTCSLFRQTQTSSYWTI